MNAVDFCDDGHQAVAFTGTCPLCRELHGGSYLQRTTGNPRPPMAEGTIYANDLRGALRKHFAEGETVR